MPIPAPGFGQIGFITGIRCRILVSLSQCYCPAGKRFEQHYWRHRWHTTGLSELSVGGLSPSFMMTVSDRLLGVAQKCRCGVAFSETAVNIFFYIRLPLRNVDFQMRLHPASSILANSHLIILIAVDAGYSGSLTKPFSLMGVQIFIWHGVEWVWYAEWWLLGLWGVHVGYSHQSFHGAWLFCQQLRVILTVT